MISSRETFTLDFGDGTRCVARVDVAQIAALPDNAWPSVIALDWEGPRQAGHFDRYRVWIADVWQHVADTANKSCVALLICPRGRLQSIVCEPGRRPEFKTHLPL